MATFTREDALEYHRLKGKPGKDLEIVDMAVQIATNNVEFSEFVSWIEVRSSQP